jgi:hypothetical protein
MENDTIKVVDGIAKLGDTVYLFDEDGGEDYAPYVHEGTVFRIINEREMAVWDKIDKIMTYTIGCEEVYLDKRRPEMILKLRRDQ